MTKEIGTIRAIYRYPIKSLEGQELPSTLLQPNAGIAGDRKWAFALDQNSNTDGAWIACSNFDRLKINPDLASFKLNATGEYLYWQNDRGQVLEIDQSSEKVIQCPAELPNLVPANQGFWDYSDAKISIINVNSVNRLSEQLGIQLDPLRFRANLYVDLPPLQELYLLGQTLEIGNIQLELIRPIDRCNATSINPSNAEIDANIPAALNRLLGHHFCGVYAQIVQEGEVKSNDLIRVSASQSPKIQIEAAQNEAAAKLNIWPRPFTISAIKTETKDTISIWLEDHLTESIIKPSFCPGQHLKILDLGSNRTFRAYTISAKNETQFRITVKKQTGEGSNAMHKFRQGDQLLASGPHGEIAIADRCESAIFLTAGIGITMATGLLPTITKRNIKVDFHHIVRNRQAAALWNEIEDFAKHRQHCSAHLFETYNGRPDLAQILQTTAHSNTQLFLCGPPNFVDQAEGVALQLGFEDHNICAERFVTPDTKDVERTPDHPGPFKVEFRKSGKSAIWNETRGNLLDFAEEQGIAINNHCRAGICGKCKTSVISGSTQSAENTGSHILCCSAFPSSNLVLDA